MLSDWALEESALADFGDERLDARLAIVLSDLGGRPAMSIPAACGGHSEMQAAYRFFDNDKVTFQKVLEPHCQRTLERLAEQKVVLLVQDTTEVDLTRPQQEVKGAGDLDGSRRGIFLHAMHGFTPDGTMWADCINRTEQPRPQTKAQKLARLKRTPIQEKESMRWLSGLREARTVAAQLPRTQCISVSDSEGDIYELFVEPRGELNGPRVDWLIRACHDRALESDERDEHRHLRQQVMSTAVLYELDLQIRERQSMTTVEKRPRRQTRQSRQARVQVRAATLTLRPPWREDCELPPVTVNVVLVNEANPPAGEEPVEWILVTTLPIGTPGQVRLVVEYYCVRWNIEILFRTLKSGCRIEWRRFEQVDRITRCLALYLIVTWRTFFVCRMGRECPDADCQTLFEPSEWKAVWAAVHQKKPPKKRPRLSEIVHLIARLGGYIERPASHPGPQTIWIGLQRMHDLSWAWETFGPQTRIKDD